MPDSVSNRISEELLIVESEINLLNEYIKNSIIFNPLTKMANNEIAIYDLFSNKYLWYLSKPDKELQAIYALGFTDVKSPDFFLNYLTKSDRHFIEQTIEQTVTFLQNKEASKRKDYLLLLDASIKLPDGYYYRLVHQSVVIESKANDHGWLVLCILHHIDKSLNYKLPLRQLSYIGTMETSLFFRRNNYQTLCFTQKQRELLRLITKGHDSNAIAKHLSISINTVNNRKARIMEMVQINKMPQLINYAKIIGLV